VLGRDAKKVLVLDTGKPGQLGIENAIGGCSPRAGALPRSCGAADREPVAEFPNVEIRDDAVFDATSPGTESGRDE